MHLSFVFPAPRYPGTGGVLVVIVPGICAGRRPSRRGTCAGLRRWLDGNHLGREFEPWYFEPWNFLPWYVGRDFVGDSALEMPGPAGKSAGICQLRGNEYGRGPSRCPGTGGPEKQLTGALCTHPFELVLLLLHYKNY